MDILSPETLIASPLRRSLLAVLFTVFLVLPAAAMAGAAQAFPTPTPPVLSASPLSGFNLHQGPALWHALHEGDALTLDSRSDPGQVAVWWGQFVIGYVRSDEATELQRRLSRGQRLRARIFRLRDVSDPARRVLVRVELAGA